MRGNRTVILLLMLTLALAGGQALADTGAGAGASHMGGGFDHGPGAGGGHDSDWNHGPGMGGGWDSGHMGNHEYLLDGEPFTFSGAVAAVNYYNGGGLVLAADQGNVTFYGIGPYWYWERQGFSWPQVGDLLTAHGYMVDYNGAEINMLISVTTADGQQLQLRDPQTGWPLWMNQQ